MNKIIIPGIPKAQARMKFTCRGGYGRVYDPMASYKKELRVFLTEYVKQLDISLLHHPRLSFIFHMPILKSFPKKLQALMMKGNVKHESKPDADNIIKVVGDCLDGILFEGDQKVSIGCAVKLYHPEPKTIIYFSDSSEYLTRSEISPEIWCDLFEEGSCGL